MKILLCNPRNQQGTKHSRKGMYVPLGLLSIATTLKKKFGDQVEIEIIDEDVEHLDITLLHRYNLVGFYATTFNYGTAVKYAYFAREQGCINVLGGPHPSVLARNILLNKSCFDYIITHEGEIPFTGLVGSLLTGDNKFKQIPNLAFRDEDDNIVLPSSYHENVLNELSIPSRGFVPFDKYVDNYRKIYPDRSDIRPGSIYSSKGCSWRDKTKGCIFCARLEEGVRFREAGQIWDEIEMLRDKHGVNSIWDIADDNLNNKEWFIDFVDRRPDSCADIKFFIYSRVGCIRPWVFEYFEKLNVEEVFLGVESGDNRLLRQSFKGQTRQLAHNAIKLLSDNNIRYFPSFVLGLPGENEKSLQNTLDLCKEIAELGGLDRMAATIIQPIPGSPAFDMVLEKSQYGKDLATLDDIDLAFLERYWVECFTSVSYERLKEVRSQIGEIMSDCQVFGGVVKK